MKSTALKFGDQTKHWLAVFATGTTSGLAISGAMMDQPWLYYAGVSVVAAHLARQVFRLYFQSVEALTYAQPLLG